MKYQQPSMYLKYKKSHKKNKKLIYLYNIITMIY